MNYQENLYSWIPVFALDAAKYIANKLIEEGRPITVLELNSFLYLIQLEWLRDYGERFLCDEFEARDTGPILQEVFYYYCGFGIMPITITATRVKDFHDIDTLIMKYSAMDKWALLDKVTNPHGAWAQTYCNGEGNRNVIPLELMRREANG